MQNPETSAPEAAVSFTGIQEKTGEIPSAEELTEAAQTSEAVGLQQTADKLSADGAALGALSELSQPESAPEATQIESLPENSFSAEAASQPVPVPEAETTITL